MSVTVEISYTGDLHCVATHGPSGDSFPTDAPVDNQGRGEHFSPTDLLGTAMGTCMLTIMGISARNNGWNMDGSTASIRKSMSADPVRHISELDVTIRVTGGPFDERAKRVLSAAAKGCPVYASLGERTKVGLQLEFEEKIGVPKGI